MSFAAAAPALKEVAEAASCDVQSRHERAGRFPAHCRLRMMKVKIASASEVHWVLQCDSTSACRMCLRRLPKFAARDASRHATCGHSESASWLREVPKDAESTTIENNLAAQSLRPVRCSRSMLQPWLVSMSRGCGCAVPQAKSNCSTSRFGHNHTRLPQPYYSS